MGKITYRTEIEYYNVIDKSAWERGPWDDEPDKVQWTDDATGLPCLIKRSRHGALCGYVGLPPEHPWYGRDYGDIPVDVHGELTFAGGCEHGDNPAKGICHIPEPGQPDNVWWLGFDCANAWDYSDMASSPEWRKQWPRSSDEIYRDIAYVRDECTKLAEQVSKEQTDD